MAKFQMVVVAVGMLTACKKESTAPAVSGSGSVTAAAAPGSAAHAGSAAAAATPAVDTPVDGPALNVGGEAEGVATLHKPQRHALHVTGTHPKEKVKIELLAKMGESSCNPDSAVRLKLLDKDDVIVDAWGPFFPKDLADWTKEEKTYQLAPGDYAIKIGVGCAMNADKAPTSNPYKLRVTLVEQ